MGEFSLWHLIVILVVVLIFFGPSRLPGLGNSLGKAIRGFKEGIKGIHDPLNEEKPAEPAHTALASGQKPDSSLSSGNSSTTNSDLSSHLSDKEKERNKI